MTRNNTILSLVVLSLVFAFSGKSFAADMKFGYVDMQKAIQQTAAGKKAKKELEAEFNKKKKALEKRQADIKKMIEDFQKRSMAMNDDARHKKQVAIQNEMEKYQEMAAQSQMQIQKKEHDLTAPIVAKLKKVIDTIAEKDHYTMILEKSEQNVLWARKDMDLTQRVIKEYDEKN